MIKTDTKGPLRARDPRAPFNRSFLGKTGQDGQRIVWYILRETISRFEAPVRNEQPFKSSDLISGGARGKRNGTERNGAGRRERVVDPREWKSGEIKASF